jgi:hypothetical protein
VAWFSGKALCSVCWGNLSGEAVKTSGHLFLRRCPFLMVRMAFRRRWIGGDRLTSYLIPIATKIAWCDFAESMEWMREATGGVLIPRATGLYSRQAIPRSLGRLALRSRRARSRCYAMTSIKLERCT